MCDCNAIVNEKLAEFNTQLTAPWFITGEQNPNRLFVETMKLDNKKRVKPRSMFASYCPFCGESYEVAGSSAPPQTPAKPRGNPQKRPWRQSMTSNQTPTTDTGKASVEHFELPMKAFADERPVRAVRQEQSILTYTENVGTYDLLFYEIDHEMGPMDFLGASHWIDITEAWPGVKAQLASFSRQPAAQPETGAQKIIAGLREAADVAWGNDQPGRVHIKPTSQEGGEP